MARAKRGTAVLSLVKTPPAEEQDELRLRLDELALAIADQLLTPDAGVNDRISGLKVLAAYHDSKRRSGETPTRNMFDVYRERTSAAKDES
jgi:hypothetical protein